MEGNEKKENPRLIFSDLNIQVSHSVLQSFNLLFLHSTLVGFIEVVYSSGAMSLVDTA